MNNERIAGLDCWRAMLVLAGLFVHASYQLPRVALFDVVEGASLVFRMGAFFAISGYLAAILLQRRAAAAWLAGRAVQLGVPAVVGMTILSPLIWWLVVTAPAAPGRVPLRYEWHHLWFLFALILYSGGAVVLDRRDSAGGLAARIDAAAGSRDGARVALWVTATVSAMLIGAAPPLMRATLSGDALLAFANVQMIAGYLPMFVLGFALARCDRLRAHYVANTGFALLILIVAAGGFALVQALPLSEVWRANARFVAAALGPPAAFALILRSALAIRRVPAAVRRIADASYTIYILHLPLAVAINTRVGAGLDPRLAYALCVALAGFGSYAIHVAVIARCPPLAILVNGRIVRRPPAIAARLHPI